MEQKVLQNFYCFGIRKLQNYKGLIVRSDIKNIFCAGLDIKELYDNKTEEEMKAMVDFWHYLQDSWLNLYKLEIPMVAAVNGTVQN